MWALCCAYTKYLLYSILISRVAKRKKKNPQYRRFFFFRFFSPVRVITTNVFNKEHLPPSTVGGHAHAGYRYMYTWLRAVSPLIIYSPSLSVCVMYSRPIKKRIRGNLPISIREPVSLHKRAVNANERRRLDGRNAQQPKKRRAKKAKNRWAANMTWGRDGFCTRLFSGKK